MRQVLWLLFAAIAGGFAVWVLHSLRRFREKKEAEAARAAAFLAQAAALVGPKAASARPPPVTLNPPPANPANPAPEEPVAEPPAIAQQRLLFEAAAKAAEAGEPVLAIQLYGRLIARFPQSALAREARAGVEAQKKKLVKGQNSA